MTAYLYIELVIAIAENVLCFTVAEQVVVELFAFWQTCLYLTLAPKKLVSLTGSNKLSFVGLYVFGLVRSPTVLGFIAGQDVCSMLVHCCCGFSLPTLNDHYCFALSSAVA